MSINKKGEQVPLSQASPDLAILGDRLTIHPPATTNQPTDLSITATSSPDRALLESYARFRTAPIEALREISKTLLGTGWRSYENPIGQPCFYSGYTDNMKSKVLDSPILKARIAQLAKKQADSEVATDNDPLARRHREKELRDQLDEVADLWTDQMICKMESKSFIRGAYYLVTQLLTRAYHQGIHVNSEEVLHIRDVAAAAAKKKQSIIFLPCHRSHIDYVSLQLVCFRLGLTLPIVVAGDNLNFPVVGPFLQHAGALWIRRSFGEDALYGTLVQSYMDTLLQNGYNVECFIEGGRSRTGKLLSPKFGILSFMMESLLSGRVNDAIICPVSTQYDKVIEVDSYISELLGQPKEKESLAGFLSASNILSLKLGRVDVRFHKPWSLRNFIDDQTSKILGTSQSLQVSYDSATKRKLLSVLGYQVLAHINDASVVMPTALIGTVLLTLRGRGVGESELVRRVEIICDKVRSRGGRVSHFGNLPTDVVVKRGLEVLGPKLVGKVEGLAEPSYFAVDRFQLSFYRNMTIHLFVSEALVCAALYTTVKHGGLENQSMSYAELRDYVFFLSQLFRTEFIFSSAPLDQNLNDTLAALERDGVLEVKRDGAGKVEEVGVSEAERELGRDNFDFYCFLIWPFIEASWLNAVSLLLLVPPPSNEFTTEDWLDYGKVQAYAQKLGKTLYHQGDLSYFEAVNKESLQKGYAREEEEGMLVIARSKDSKVKPRVRLSKDWMPVRDDAGHISLGDCKLWHFAERISTSRREGKDRRDSAMMHSRVIRFIDIVSEELWANAAVDKVANPDVSNKKPTRRKLQTKPARL